MAKPLKVKIKGKVYGIDFLSLLFLCVCVLILFVGGYLITKGFMNMADKEEGEPVETVVSNDPDDLYNKEEFAIDRSQYQGTILERTENAGRTYVEETLFIGDTNVARFLRYQNTDNLAFTDIENTIGVVGLGIEDLEELACLDTTNGRLTIAQAITALQPKRILLNVGTYSLLKDKDEMLEAYRKSIKQFQEAYPSVDVIVNAVPPIGKKREYTNLTMQMVDAFNLGLADMCKQEGWYFLASYEDLKDDASGFAQEEFVEEDGIQLSERGLVALFEYIRMHAESSSDDRPTPLQNKPKVIGVPDGLIATNPLNGEAFEELPETVETPTPRPTPAQQQTTPYVAPAATPTPTPSATPTPTPEESVEPSIEPTETTDPTPTESTDPAPQETTPTEEASATPESTPEASEGGESTSPESGGENTGGSEEGQTEGGTVDPAQTEGGNTEPAPDAPEG